MPASLIAGFDKCFAAAWLDHKHVVLGTKDNALVVMDVDARSCERVALPARREYRPAERRRHPRRFATRNADVYVGDVLTRRDSNPGGHALMRVETTIVANVVEPRATLRDFFGGFGDVWGSLAEDVATSPSTSGFDSASDSDSDWDSDSDVNHPFRAAENCGIHAIAINPSRTRLVTGGENPCDAAVFSVSAGDDDASGAAGGLLSPSALLVGHRDWVFGVDWITDNVLASGSRDTTVRIWSVPDSAESSEAHGGVAKTRRGENAVPEIRVPVASIRAHADRVRDVKYVRGARRLASLSVDGTVVFTDPETMAVSETRRLRSRRELMCLATDGVDTVAVGSQAHVALLDHRQRAGRSACEKRLPHDDADGVRSLSFSGGGRLLTIGGGGGRLFFFDVAAGKYLPRVRGEEDEDGSLGARADERRDDAAKDASGGLPDSPGVRDARRVHGDDAIAPPGMRPPRDGARRRNAAPLAFRTGEGFLDREHDAFLEHFATSEDWFAARNACYAHAWDASGTRLLVTGGPLAYGLKGCYVGVWR